jgi:D-apionolactonase
MLTDPRLLTGRPNALPEPTVLHAGPVTALLDGADLRHVRLRDIELVQRVYIALRDAPWNTIPAVFSNVQMDRAADRFRVTFDAHHAFEAIDFAWRGVIDGSPDGTIRYEMDGTCRAVFRYSKIGFNVHHALDRSVGHAYRARTEHGELRGVLPPAIEPQRIVGTTLTGMFAPYSELAIGVAPGLEAVIALEGDLLEMQDHRNWTDGNFKSYGTPLALGFPFDSAEGQRIRQVLTIRFAGPVSVAAPERPPTITVGPPVGPLPAIGFGQPSHGEPLSAGEAGLVATVNPAHLRVDLALNDPAVAGHLARAAADARSVGAALELAIHASEASGPALADLATRLADADIRVARVLTYYLSEGFSSLLGLTPGSVVRLVREHLGPVVGEVPFAGGTNQNFSDINRDRPSDPVFTGVCFSISPTVHAADDASIVENLVGQSEVVQMARSFANGRRIAVSPVTIATRFGPYPAGPPTPDDLPAPVDVRQGSLLGAAWTVGSIKHIAEGGADSVTYYETTGWRGIVERTAGSPDARFPSRPSQAFPMFHVFADVAEWGAGTVLAAPSTRPLETEALAVEDDAGLHLLVASLVPTPRRVVITGLHGRTASVRMMDAASAEVAMQDPAAFRQTSMSVPIAHGSLELELGPFAVARVDVGA